MVTHDAQMDAKDRRWPALLAWLLTVSAALIAFGIEVATRDTPVPTSWGFRGASEAFGLTCGTVGVVIALRRPGNLNGWLFCAIGLLFAAEALINEYVIAAVLVIPGGLPWTTGLGWLLTWVWVPPLGIALIFLPLLFPTGRLLSRRLRLAAGLGVVAIVVFGAAVAFAPGPIEQATFVENPLGGVSGLDVATYSGAVVGLAWTPLAIAIGLSLSSLVVRFHRASDDARRQIKWFSLAVMIAGAVFVLYIAVYVLGGSPVVIRVLEVLVIASLLGLPAAAGMAILRYRLYDIDRIVSRTISYGVVTAFLVAVFLLVNLALQAGLSGVTSNNALAVAGSTLLAATLFTPVRQRVQRAVDRRFDRARYDFERTATAFSERLRDEVDLLALGRDLDATVRQAVAPASIGLWLREVDR